MPAVRHILQNTYFTEDTCYAYYTHYTYYTCCTHGHVLTIPNLFRLTALPPILTARLRFTLSFHFHAALSLYNGRQPNHTHDVRCTLACCTHARARCVARRGIAHTHHIAPIRWPHRPPANRHRLCYPDSIAHPHRYPEVHS